MQLTASEAFSIVLDLAEQNVLSARDAYDNDAEHERERQLKALCIIREFAKEIR